MLSNAPLSWKSYVNAVNYYAIWTSRTSKHATYVYDCAGQKQANRMFELTVR